jgi:hypothetical protein
MIQYIWHVKNVFRSSSTNLVMLLLWRQYWLDDISHDNSTCIVFDMHWTGMHWTIFFVLCFLDNGWDDQLGTWMTLGQLLEITSFYVFFKKLI